MNNIVSEENEEIIEIDYTEKIIGKISFECYVKNSKEFKEIKKNIYNLFSSNNFSNFSIKDIRKMNKTNIKCIHVLLRGDNSGNKSNPSLYLELSFFNHIFIQSHISIGLNDGKVDDHPVPIPELEFTKALVSIGKKLVQLPTKELNSRVLFVCFSLLLILIIF